MFLSESHIIYPGALYQLSVTYSSPLSRRGLHRPPPGSHQLLRNERRHLHGYFHQPMLGHRVLQKEAFLSRNAPPPLILSDGLQQVPPPPSTQAPLNLEAW